jgi:hypothetical protein
LRGGSNLVEQGRIAAVDFDQVVNEEHRYDAKHINPLGRMRRQHEREERDMPTMLGGILAACAVGDAVAMDNGLEPVGLEQEAKLRGERFGRRQQIEGPDAPFAGHAASLKEPASGRHA